MNYQSAMIDRRWRSWYPVAEDAEFPLQNLPYGVFERADGQVRVGVALGDQVVDLAELQAAGLLAGTPAADKNLFDQSNLNLFLEQGIDCWTAVRMRLAELLRADSAVLRDDVRLRDRAMIPQAAVQMFMPVRIGNYVDFYSSREHASNVGKMFRDPNKPLLPNWLHLPVGYNGRASSVITSGVNFHRPCGQFNADESGPPSFGPTRQLDIELEVGFITGTGNSLSVPITTWQAANHIFGLVLLNDWSARDIQKWEYVPLGPFLGKSFATSISPWVVPLAALEPFRVAGPLQDPPVLPYLQYEGDWAYDLQLEVWLQTARMNNPQRICRTDFKYMYWNMVQQLAHMTVNGTNVQSGDLYGSGTVSGPTPDSFGSLLELCWKGTQPIRLSSGEERRFLEDGDTVILRGWGQGEGFRVGFGELRTTVLPAKVNVVAENQ
ncbi:MAG: hypothetical protein HJJLKODD_00229 [Phycisphaerae bacterium]|nr:hypothetical protein [Phycisphaerae bacterium]